MNKINLSRDNPGMGLFHFVRKLIVILKWTIFSLVPCINYSNLVFIIML